ncbi:MAG TPA: DUF3501 family protein [Gammaproteobacteria bacterium]
MDKLTVADLYSLEQYHKVRADFRAKVLEHKRRRQAAVGPNVTLSFEDRLTMQYQVQEMLRIERIFEQEAIEEELAAYNPLIPDGSNLKATMMIEFPDVEQRRRALNELAGIEDTVYLEVAGFDRVPAIADEDLERTTEGKTSAVHFLRFELTEPMKQALRDGAALAFGVDHPRYRHRADASAELREALLADLA